MVEFGESLPSLRRKVSFDLKGNSLERSRVLAAMVRLIDQGFFRIGNDRSAASESTYGLSTILASHVRVAGDVLSFDYVGKWRKKQRRSISDAAAAAVVAQLKSLGGGELFRFDGNGRVLDVKDRHVNEYIQSVIGRDFTAKDFRTWAGTLLCAIALALEGQAESRTERKRRVRKAVVATSEQLGNTPAVCRSSYICPRLIDEYMEGRAIEALRPRRRGSPVVRNGLSSEERALLRFLRETIADRRRVRRAA